MAPPPILSGSPGHTKEAVRGWMAGERAGYEKQRVDQENEGPFTHSEKGVCPPGQCVLFGDWVLGLSLCPGT